MDVATRFQARQRAQSYLDRERNVVPDDSSGPESESLVRRKFQRTAGDPDPASSDASTFRKPSLPASATRQPSGQVGVDTRGPMHQRRRSTLRDNVRVPSGPREFPSPGKRVSTYRNSNTTPPLQGTINAQPQQHQRPFLPHVISEPFFSKHGEATRFSFGNHSSNDTDSPTTPAENTSSSFDFLPTVNFDDFQTSLAHYDGTSPLLSDFPTHGGGTVLPKEEENTTSSIGSVGAGAGGMARHMGLASQQQKRAQQRQDLDQQNLSRGQSFRRRMSSISNNRQTSQSSVSTLGSVKQKETAATSALPDQQTAGSGPLSLRTRRQSQMPPASAGATAAQLAFLGQPVSRAPRKSVGPGLPSNISDTQRTRQPTGPSVAQEGVQPKSTHPTRTTSISNKARRTTTVQPSASASSAELPRLSTLGATTQSRQAKTKSFHGAPKDELNTPQNASTVRPTSKGSNLRATTPSSSGNKRQSTISGRASGLGARTISPTDARRLKRMSMINAPPMPTAPAPKGPPAMSDELPLHLQGAKLPYPELPRQSNPSPSLIPRKASRTPSSARASPDSGLRQAMNAGPRGSGISLSSKSSYQSLLASSNSASRLPTPKTRSLHSAASATYGGGGGVGGSSESFGEEEMVPPVPAIPKAYESPKEYEVPFVSDVKISSAFATDSDGGVPTPFGGRSTKSQDPSWVETALSIPSMGTEAALLGGLPAEGSKSTRTSSDIPRLPVSTPKKQASGDSIMQGQKPSSFSHRRTATSGSINANTNLTTPRKQEYDPAGRKNANLQPLRLPPLNLLPFGSRIGSDKSDDANGQGRKRNEGDRNHALDSGTKYDHLVHTPEPNRAPKTPSTPMTASKATFFKRSHTDQPGYMRSSSSHFALRDVLTGTFGDEATRWFDESDLESGNNTYHGGVAIPKPQQNDSRQRGITPFASGSLPKASGEFVRNGLRGRPSGEYSSDEYTLGHFENLQVQSAKPQGARSEKKISTPVKQATAGNEAGSPALGSGELAVKKESSSGGLRRKLSNRWRRSTSKSASHADHQTEEGNALRGKKSKDFMPPPRLPASSTWSGDVPQLPSSTRQSLEQASTMSKLNINNNRRKSTAGNLLSLGMLGSHDSSQQQQPPPAAPKSTRVHSEQPQPVHHTANRSTSWSSFMGNRQQNGPQRRQRQESNTPFISALSKDKDDVAADEEMRRLSQKRRDVDAAAKESEALRIRAIARSPLSPEKVLHDRSSGLNIYERGEIVDYAKDGVYFTGTRTAKKVIGSLAPSPSNDKSQEKAGNYGYDDERGDYNIVLGDHLSYRYEVVDVLGKGSFGQVVRCVDHKDGGVVAVKIIRNKKRFHQQALVEVGILQKLREWDPNGDYATLSITSSFYFRSHLCIVTPCLGMNLYELIRAHNFTGFSVTLIRRFARQLLACLTLLQQRRIIHCDLKPENILISDARKADVRVIDFGSSCKEEEKVYTYIQSRFYRSPEVILGSSYGLGIDMWSFGCILAELWTGYPIFPGENEQEQLACIMEIFGPPDKRIIDLCTRKKLFFDSMGKPRVTVSSKGRRRRPSSKTLQQSLKTDDEAFIDFVARCLRWDPDRRMKPQDAVSHPFITNLSMKTTRSGIPDEARRAAKLRPTAAVPTPAAAANGGPGVPSPVKRSTRQQQAEAGNAFAQQQAQQTTPAKQRRDVPGTPQTAVRTAPSANHSQNSPSKPTIASANRRHSTVATAGGATAMAGNKRASNGAVLAGAAGMGTIGGGPVAGIGGAGHLRLGSVKVGSTAADLAQLAAAQSMSGAQQQPGNASKWRT